jgi:nucleoside-diphosphate-sugar epimerase
VSALPPRVAPELPRRVLVTGAHGFIGQALVRRLRELGVEARGIDVRTGADPSVVRGSTLDPGPWVPLLEGVGAIVHTAAIVSNTASHDDAWRVNVLGTRRLLEAAAAAGVPRLVHLSSIMAYGFGYPDGVDETFPVRVTGYSYIDTRVNSEAVVMTAHSAGEVEATVVRPGDVIGPGSIWVRQPIAMSRRRLLMLPANGTGVFTPVYVDNLVDAILLAVASPSARGQVFTVTDGYGVACGDYFGALARMAGGTVTTLPTPVAVGLAESAGSLMRALGRPNELTAATMLMLARTGGYSIEKARTVLGFEPRVSYELGMSRIEAWAADEGLI